MTYLDYNATAPMRPEVAEAMVDAFAIGGNASSVHAYGRAARKAIEAARARIAALIGAAPGDVVFTSGGTEANNLALSTAARRPVVSAIEHPSVLVSAEGRNSAVIPVDGRGVVDLDALTALLAEDGDRAIVSVMLVNNETGVVQPIEHVTKIAHEAGALVHCDAVQAAGRQPIDMSGLGVDFLSLSAHKLGGPPGVGALMVAADTDVAPLIRGGGQEKGRRGGTENLPGIVGFGAAAESAAADLEHIGRLAALRDEMEAKALQAVPEAVVVGRDAARVANTSCLAMPGVASETQVIALDLAGLAVSAGSACSSGKVRRSHVLTAMGLPDDVAGCAIRVSLGWATERDDIDRFVEGWTALHGRMTSGERVDRKATAA